MPTGKFEPGRCVLVKFNGEQLSVAKGGVQLTSTPQELLAERMISAGQPDITGGVLSFMVTANTQVVMLPDRSVAV